MDTPDTVASLRLELLEAFTTGKFPAAVRLCHQILSRSPDDPLATRYFDRLQDALERGLGIPLELRVGLQRAAVLAHLQRYEEAEAAYERLHAAVIQLEMPRWRDLAEARLQLERLRDASRVAAAADAEFQRDNWEAAARLYQHALTIAPDFRELEGRAQIPRRLLEAETRLRQFALSVESVDAADAHRLATQLIESKGLQLDYPESARVRSLVEAAERALAARRQSLADEIRECLHATDEYGDSRILTALLRRAQQCLQLLAALPGDRAEHAALEREHRRREADITLARELEGRARVWFGWPRDPAPEELNDNDRLVEQLTGILSGLTLVEANWKQAQALMPALRFCAGALAAETSDDFLALAAEPPFRDAAGSPISWQSAWERQQAQLLTAARLLGELLRAETPARRESVRGALDRAREEQDDQITPLRQLTDAIVVRWTRLAGHAARETGHAP